jgi:hypothetical protein
VWIGLALAVPMFVKRLVGNHPAPAPKLRTYLNRLVFDHDGTPDDYRSQSVPADSPGPDGEFA